MLRPPTAVAGLALVRAGGGALADAAGGEERQTPLVSRGGAGGPSTDAGLATTSTAGGGPNSYVGTDELVPGSQV